MAAAQGTLVDAHDAIHYAVTKGAWAGYVDYVQDKILRSGAQRVLELGGGANPLLPMEFARRHGVEYTVLDISQAELAKAPAGYRKVCGDIGSPALELAGLEGGYDLVFSKMLAEHVRNGEQMHRNVFRMLAPAGKAVHYFPTLFAPPFIVNRLFPERLADRLLQWLEPGRERDGNKGKFPAYYSWCRGPTHRQLERFRGLGYDIEEYIGYFGHSVYYRKIPGVRTLHRRLSEWLATHPVPALTSSAYVVLAKPAAGDTGKEPGLRPRPAPDRIAAPRAR